MSKTVGEYVLKEKIGKGSYADVYKGTHKVTGQKFAIKAISKDILSEPKLLAGLESEIKIMREFAHDNIVRLHEYFSSEKNFYLVLELCEGGDLSKFIKKKKRLDERLAHSFLTQITSGLAFLHERNFIHRDLKPANVLLSEFSDNAVLKLADFGFARQLTVASLAQTRCGTPLYMAPEILESKDYDGKADIWSVGCIFYEMLVGTSPFKGTNEADLLMNIKTKELNVPKDVVLSKVSIEILIKLLERHPIRRASLPQLVALCTHLSSTLPPPSTASSGTEEAGLALPLPSPSEVRTPEMSRSRPALGGATPSGEAPESTSRRRLESAEGVDPNFISPSRGRGYNGGPAPSNLQGMLNSPPPSTEGHSVHNAGAPISTPQKGAAYDGSSGRRHSVGSYPPQASDTQFSKTLRAPYAGGPATGQKYPSPSSSPPTGVMSAVGGFLQSANAPVHASQVQPSTSPAAAAVGMVGNLIAYVFNPSPSPTAAFAEAGRSHSQQARHGSLHGRSFSADRGVPPTFASGSTNTGYFGSGGGAGTPPPGSRARTSVERKLREDHFAYPDTMDATYATRSPNPNSSTASMEDDFVLINNSLTEGERKAGRSPVNANTAHRPTLPPSASASESSSGSSGRSAGAPSGGNSFAGAPTTAPDSRPQQYDMEQDARANETAAVQAFYASTVQRCQVYSDAVTTITALGDDYVREGQAPLQKAQQRQQAQRAGASMVSVVSDEDEESIAGFVQPSGELLNPYLKQVAVDRYAVACSLYIHALTLLTRLMKSFDAGAVVEIPAEYKDTLQTLKMTLKGNYDQILSRMEICQKHIDAMVNADGSRSFGSKFNLPPAEAIMHRQAERLAADACNVEEMKGNLVRASQMYLSAKSLYEGIALTANDPEHQRYLHSKVSEYTERYEDCRRRAAELQIYS